MLIDIENIIVQDRIRKDFGDIQELAKDIKENGLINPPVVTPVENGKCQLIAGERRLRAMKSLGYQQIEVRPMSVRDAEHQLDLEYSENAMRKDFRPKEITDYARRKLRIESAKAKERANANLVQNADRTGNISHSEEGRARDKVAKEFGMSGRQLEKMLTIENNKSLISEEDFAEWDEGRLSTNKAYQKVKARMRELEDENLELRRRPVETRVVEKQIVPEDYEELKLGYESMKMKARESDKNRKEANLYRRDYEEQRSMVAKKNMEIKKLQEEHEKEISEILNKKSDVDISTEKFRQDLENQSILFVGNCGNFIKNNGGYVWIADHINEISESGREHYIKSAEAIYAWAQNLLRRLEANE